MENETIKLLKQKYEEKFDSKYEGIYYSPGRINLIGEHIDYSGGNVFPAAITKGTYAIARKREDTKIRCYSLNFPEFGPLELSLNDLEYNKTDNWVNYVKGVIKYFIEVGHKIDTGFDIVIYGDIPNGAGLSSSASLELLIGVMLKDLYDLDIDRLDIIKIGQKVENEYLGVNSGIMDQFAVGKGEKDKAIYLDTHTLDYKLVPADFKNNVILIMNTNKRRELADSNYNQRRAECEEALKLLQQEINIESLGELSAKQFEKYKYFINDETLTKRAKHAVYENVRVKKAVEVLKDNDLKSFGKLLNESHISLKDDYDITGIELDTIVDLSWKQEGVLGARMTGAGMGGCAIALVDRTEVDRIIENIQKGYTKKIGYEASFYIAEIGDGAKVLK